MWSVGPPGSGSGSPSRTSLAPMSANSETSTLRPSGTRMSAPPMIVMTRSRVRAAVSSASLRSRSLPPQKLMLMALLGQRASGRGGRRRRGSRGASGCRRRRGGRARGTRPRAARARRPAVPASRGTTSAISRSSSARVRAANAWCEPLVELVDGQPALAGRVAQRLGGVLAIGVGRPQLGRRAGLVAHRRRAYRRPPALPRLRRRPMNDLRALLARPHARPDARLGPRGPAARGDDPARRCCSSPATSTAPTRRRARWPAPSPSGAALGGPVTGPPRRPARPAGRAPREPRSGAPRRWSASPWSPRRRCRRPPRWPSCAAR